MSDETFEYITTDYMISIESNEQTIQPVEYIVELGQEGIPGKQGEKGDPGFSPTVGYNLSDGHLTFTIVNEDGVTVTPDVFDYVMRKNGSNAINPVTINHLTMGYQYGSPYINSDSNLYIRGSVISLQSTNDINLTPTGTSKAKYKNNEIATVNDISDATITLTQGGVTKGTFTLNGSATTIDLDEGGAGKLYIDGSNADANFTVNGVELAGNYVYINSVPYGGIHATQTDSNIYYQLGVNSNRAFLSMPAFTLNSYPAVSTGGTFAPAESILNTTGNLSVNTSNGKKLLYNSNEVATKADMPTTMTGADGVNAGTSGLVPAPSATDNDKYLCGDGTWKAVSSGTTYTEGTGIDITSDVISIDNTVALKSEIPTVNNSTITFTQGGTTKGSITLNQSSDATIALDAGSSPDNPLEPLTDSKGLADVTNYAHSTFDSTKFTNTGTPTVTGDGLLYPTVGNGLYTSSIPFDNKSFEFKYSFTPTGTPTQSAGILSFYNGVNLYQGNNGGFSLTIPTALTGLSSAYYINVSGVTLNAPVILNLTFNSNTLDLTVSFTQGTTELKTQTITLVTTFASQAIYMQGAWGSDAVGYIDLKYLSVTVDGIPVFNGNQTGIDTIKPNDYTVVGSPTISADGVASGFSSSNHVTASINKTYDIVNNTYNFRIKYKYDTNGNGVIARIGRFWIVLDNTNIRLQGQDTNSAAKNFTNVTIPTPSVGDEYIITGSFGDSGNTRSLSVSINGGTPINGTNTANTPNLSTQTSVNIWIGINNNATPLVAGSIDLNAFKVYINGSLVYQPCLKIPYTLGNGSRVVDSYYRNRIEDAYNYQGYVRYYTLKEGTNYTLPTQPDKGYLSNLAWVYNNINSIPDYSAGITMDLGNSNFTAPAKGIIVLAGYTTGQGGSIGGILTININSNTVYSNSTSYSGTTYFDLCLPVDSGDVISLVAITTPATINTQKFFPLKEVN